MAKKKKYTCYAVVDGKGNERITNTWSECERFRDANPSGARFHGFYSRNEAKKWLAAARADQRKRNHASSKPVHTQCAKKEQEQPYYAVVHKNGDAFITRTWERAQEIMRWNPSGEQHKRHASMGEAVCWILSKNGNLVGVSETDIEL